MMGRSGEYLAPGGSEVGAGGSANARGGAGTCVEPLGTGTWTF